MTRTASLLFALTLACGVAAVPVRAAPVNVRFYAVLDETAELSLDGTPLSHIENGSIYFFTMTPGAHSLSATTASGATVTQSISLDEGDMATGHDRKWWCIVFGKNEHTGALVLRVTNQKACQGLVDAAPANDLSRGAN